MADFTLKTGDTAPSLVVTLNDTKGAVIDLTGATVVFTMRRVPTEIPVFSNRSATVLSIPNRLVEYAWQAGDTDTPGHYLGEFKVTYANGKPGRFPSSRYISIEIMESLS